MHSIFFSMLSKDYLRCFSCSAKHCKKSVGYVWIPLVDNVCNWSVNGSNASIVTGGKDTITFSDPALPVAQRSRSPLLAFTDKPQKTEAQGEHLQCKEHDESWALISFQIKSNEFSCWDSRRQSFSGHRDWINHPQMKWIDGPSTNSKETTGKWLLNRLLRDKDQVLHLKEFSCQITWFCEKLFMPSMLQLSAAAFFFFLSFLKCSVGKQSVKLA